MYIILPVHNRRELTKKFVSSLLNQTFKDFHLLLVDDGSTDGTDEMVKSLIPTVTIFKGKGDWWWAGSIQQAYYWIKKNVKVNDVVLIINDDLVFENDYLEKGFNYVMQNPNAMVLSAAYNHKDRSFLEDCGVIYNFKTSEMNTMPINKLDQLNCASTRGLFLRVSDFLLTKGMRPFLLPHYFSDYEFTIRAKHKYGLKLRCFLDLKVYMDNETSGIRDIQYTSLREYLKKSCDKRYKGSPIYTANYFLLAFPFPYNIKLSLPYIKGFVKTVIKLLIKYK